MAVKQSRGHRSTDDIPRAADPTEHCVGTATHLDDALDVVFVLHVLEDGEDARHAADGVERQRVHQVLAVQHARHVVPVGGDSDPVYMSRKIRKFRTDKFDGETNENFDSCKLM